MTDGMIQEVFKKGINIGNTFRLSNGQCVMDVRYVKELEQELIEKIRLRMSLHNSAWHFKKIYTDSLTKDLIGDNE